VFFFKGTLRVPLHRFFAVTSAILMLVRFKLALTGLHELSEGAAAASSQAGMALIGHRAHELFSLCLFWGAALVDFAGMAIGFARQIGEGSDG